MIELTYKNLNFGLFFKPEHGFIPFKSSQHVANYVETIYSFAWFSWIVRRVVNMENVTPIGYSEKVNYVMEDGDLFIKGEDALKTLKNLEDKVALSEELLKASNYEITKSERIVALLKEALDLCEQKPIPYKEYEPRLREIDAEIEKLQKERYNGVY